MKTNFEAIAREVCLLLGCVVGSGFVGGRELLSVFGEGNLFSVLLFVVLFCFALAVLLKFCLRRNFCDFAELNMSVFKGFHGILNCALILCYFVVTATILAIANDCLTQIFPLQTTVPLYSVVATFLSFLVMRKGMDGIKKFSLVSIPFVLFYLLIVYIAYFPSLSFLTSTHSSLSALKYASFSVVMSLGVVSSTSTRLSKKSAFSALGLFGVVLLLFAGLQLAISSNPQFHESAIPLFAVVKENPVLLTIGGVAVLFAILSSLVTNTIPIVEFVDGFVEDFSLSSALVFFLALLLSFLGFDFIVDYCFPLVSAVGVFIVLAVAFEMLKERIRH